MELKYNSDDNIKGKYFFTFGSFEKDGFQNSHLKNSKYIGRFKTKDKYLGLLFLLETRIYHKKTFKYEVDIAFFDKYSDFIIGDVFFIEDDSIENKLDNLKCIINNSSIKENIIVTNLETSTSFFNNNKSSFVDGEKKINEELKCFTYFSNFNFLEDVLELAKDIVNEYTIEEKIKALETIAKLDALKGKDSSMSEFFIKMQELKNSGQDMGKLLE